MGYQDRDYYRSDQRQNPYIQSVVIKLIIINVVVFFANLFFSNNNQLMETLAVHGDTIAKPWMWWQFFTAGFAHDPKTPAHIGFNMIGLYCFGKALEERFGWKEYLRFYLTAIVLGNVIWSARNYFLMGPLEMEFKGQQILDWGAALGASGGVTASVILFCLLYPRATILLFMIIPVPAWLAGLLIVGLDMFAIAPFGGRIAHDIHLIGAAFALAYWYFGWNFGRLPGVYELGRFGKSIQRKLKSRPALRVNEEEPGEDFVDADAEADRILAKISAHGKGSLTPRELEFLDEYSKVAQERRAGKGRPL